MDDPFDFSWMKGRCITSVEGDPHDNWTFRLSDGGIIGAHSPWRLISHGRVHVTSLDHGHQFGLPQPVDACTHR